MLDGRVYRTAFLPALVALFVAAFALQDRPSPGRSALPADTFSAERAFGATDPEPQSLNGLAKAFPDRTPGSAGDHALADFIARGELDRHLRRMRIRYRARRDALVEALDSELPEATVKGIAAGLHVTAELPPGYDTATIRRAALEQRIVLRSLDDYEATGPPTLMLGYGNLPEPAIVPGVRELAKIVRQHRPARDV